jgi:hypothetical protein
VELGGIGSEVDLTLREKVLEFVGVCAVEAVGNPVFGGGLGRGGNTHGPGKGCRHDFGEPFHLVWFGTSLRWSSRIGNNVRARLAGSGLRRSSTRGWARGERFDSGFRFGGLGTRGLLRAKSWWHDYCLLLRVTVRSIRGRSLNILSSVRSGAKCNQRLPKLTPGRERRQGRSPSWGLGGRDLALVERGEPWLQPEWVAPLVILWDSTLGKDAFS